MSTWIYGPVGIFLNLPATFADNAVGALQSAFVMNTLVVLGPFALVFIGSRELRKKGPSYCVVGCLVTTLLVPRPNLVLQVADHAAIGFGLLSCWCLARVPIATAGRLALAAALCALAIWSKQITIFLLLAQLVYVFVNQGAKSAMAYTAWTALFGTVALAVFIWLFGFTNLWLNLVDIPGRLPWADFERRVMMRPWSTFAQILVPLALLVFIKLKGWWPDRRDESGRFFQLAVLTAGAMLPVGLAGFFKIGGDTNLLHSWDYLLPSLVLLWLARIPATSITGLRFYAVILIALAVRTPELRSLPSRPYTGHFAAAHSFVKTFPHAIWFPQNPVLTFYAEGKLWHTEDGVRTRHLAGYGIRENDFRRHLPSNLQAFVYPSVVDEPFVMPLLPDFKETGSLPYWKIFTRPGPTTPSP